MFFFSYGARQACQHELRSPLPQPVAGWVAPIEHFQPCLHVSMSALFHPSHGTRTLTPLEPRPSLGLAPLPLRTLSPQWCGPTSFLLGPEEATIDASVKNAADFTSSSWSARIFEQCPVSALHTNQVQIHTSSETMKIDMIFDKRLQRRKEQQHTQKITHPLLTLETLGHHNHHR